MAYWGNEPEKNDFAFDSVGAIVCLIMKNMKRDMESVERSGHMEHSIAAHAKLLRVIEQSFPAVVRPSVGAREIEEMRRKQDAWFEKTYDRMTESQAAAIRELWSKEIEDLASVLGIQKRLKG